MKKLSKLFAMLMVMAIAVSSFGMMSVSADVKGAELIADGGFDKTTGSIVYGLGKTSAVSGIEYSYAESYEGKASVHVKITSSTAVAKVTDFKLKANEKYNFSFMIKGDLHNNGMYLRMGGWSYEANAAKIIEQNGVFKESGTGDALIKITDAGNGWYKVESETPWTCGSGTGDEANLIYPQIDGNFYIDNFSITDANGNEYVLNGGFEPDTKNAVVTELGNTAHIDGVEYATGVGYKDNSSVHVTKSAYVATTTGLKLANGSAYNFSFYIKGSLPATNGMYLRMGGWQGQQNAQIKQSNGEFVVSSANNNLKVTKADNGWYKVETTTPWTCGNSTDASSALLFPQSGGGNPNFYIDDFSITLAAKADTTGAKVTHFGNTSAMAGLEYSNVEAYNSNNSVHITKGGEMTTPTKLGLTKGKTYNISFMIKGILNTSNGMYLRMGWSYSSNQAKIKSDSNGVFSVVAGAGDGIIKATAAENGWYKIESTTPWTCGEMNIGFFNVQSSGGTVNFYIDDLSIIDSETGIEKITDGGFETVSISGSELITNGSFAGEKTKTTGAVITQLNTAAVTGVEYSTAEAYSGSRSVNVNVSEETGFANTANLGMELGKSYFFSFMIKGQLNTANGMYIRTGWNSWDLNMAKIKSNANGEMSIAAGTNITLTAMGDGWYKVESKTPWLYNTAMNLFTVAGGGTPDFYIDDLSITEAIPDTVIGEFAMAGETAEKTVTISVKNNGFADGYSAILILATHKDGVMQNVAMDDNATVIAIGKTETLTQTIKVNEGETLKAYLWNSLDGMTPIKTSQELITITVE